MPASRAAADSQVHSRSTHARPAAPMACADRRIAQKCDRRSGHRRNVAAVDKLTGLTGEHRVGRTTRKAGDDGKPGSRRLEVHDAEPLDVQPASSCTAWHRKDLARVVVRG